MEKRWIQQKNRENSDILPGLDQDIHPLVVKILADRGYEQVEEIRAFLAPKLSDMLDPRQLLGMQAAVERLMKALRDQESVCVYGDYDVDGITGTTLLVSFLRATGFNCRYFIPNRFDDGYGLNADSLECIIADGTTVIISVDCGITAVDEAKLCRLHGVDLIIVDHHAPKSEIPDACAVINPLQPGCPYPYKSLAGVGVAFNLLIALRTVLREQGASLGEQLPDLREWLDLVAMGTIADVVPLTGQNRIYVHHGLKQLSKSVKPGICALKRVAGVGDSVSCGQVGFRMAPRLNAAGRMESAVPGVDLLLSASVDESNLIAADLDAANAERQAIERRIFEDADRQIQEAGNVADRHSIVLASADWHQGVVGIVASRLVERYHRPTILIALSEDGHGKGSGRSIPGFHLLEAINACSCHLERYGGHRHAAGVGLQAHSCAAFADCFETVAASQLSDGDLVPTLKVDAEVGPEDISRELVASLLLLEPFGSGNPEPVLCMRGMKIIERRIVGEGHLRLRLTRDGFAFTAIAFRMADRVVPELIDIAFYPELNVWNGTSSVQLRIKDLRQAE